MPHLNRSKDSSAPGRNPKPEEMRAVREALGLAPAEAAKLCFNTGQWWEDCEAGRKRCHPAIWQYWLSRVDAAGSAAPSGDGFHWYREQGETDWSIVMVLDGKALFFHDETPRDLAKLPPGTWVGINLPDV